MKISILTPDLSHNCLGRAYLLAKILQRHYDVEIVGPIFGEGIWEPVENDKSIIYKYVKVYGRLKPYWQIGKLIKKIDGDVIYASKPLFSSFGIGSLKKILKRKPLILDIDDWQMGLIKESYNNLSFFRELKSSISSTVFLYNTSSYWNNFFGEKIASFANEITVSNRFLQEKFGGEIVWHARDTGLFSPEKFDKDLLREKYKIEKTKKVIMFFGTPRAHKGIEDLIEAMNLIQDKDVLLMIVGIDLNDYYCKKIIKNAQNLLDRERFIWFYLQPFEKVPEILTLADVIVIPQRKSFAAVGQMPAKVFDAMALAKPIIATNVSDLPEVLENCGIIVEPENPEELAKKIQYLLINPEKAKEMGNKAREKCKAKYSFDAMEKVLVKIFQKYE
ncbi:MAG TPA: glycosyltransferase family 4 protein [Defluviitaleaceae bacterium]|nr:glycosyltransferase family 4 protein [Defluviitaleaceae bacterium]